MPFVGAVQAHQQLYQRRLSRSAWPHKSNGFTLMGRKTDALQRVLAAGLVLKKHPIVFQFFNGPKLSRRQWFGLGLFLHQIVKIVEAGLCFAIGNDDVANFLQWAENKKAVKRQRQYFARQKLIVKYQIQQGEHDDLPQKIYKCALHKAQHPDAFYFPQLQAQYLVGIFVESLYFLIGKAKAFYQLNVAQTFGSAACK